MSQAAFVQLVLQLAWLAWTPAVLVLAARGLRSSWPTERRALAVLLGVVVALLAAVFALPFSIDASGVMELTAASPVAGDWKGVGGKALVAAWTRVGLGPFGVIVVARLFLVLAAALAAALLRRRGARGEAAEAAGDSRAWLFGTLVLLALPSFTFGILAVHAFFFYSPVVLATLLALDELERGPSVAGGIVLVAGLAIVGFARPELLVAGGLVSAVVVVVALRRRRPWLAAGSGLVLLLFVWTAPDVLGYLLDRMRSQPLLMGSEVAGGAPAGQVALIGLKRVAAHLPRNALFLLVSLHVVLVLAVLRLRQLARARRAAWPELAAALFLVVELIAIGIHREGFSRLAKYGQLVTVPAWFLALSGAWGAFDVARRQVWSRRVVVVCAAFLVPYLAVELLDVGRDGLRPGRSWRSRQDDLALLWRHTPAISRRLCRPAGAAPARVLVLGLDEHGRRARALGRHFGVEASVWESDRWPIVHQLRRNGCTVHAVYPQSRAPAGEVLATAQPALPAPVDRGAPGLPPRVLVTFRDARRRAELRDAVGGAWRIEAEVDGATLLVRSAPPAE
jgi:hypothetical protein